MIEKLNTISAVILPYAKILGWIAIAFGSISIGTSFLRIDFNSLNNTLKNLNETSINLKTASEDLVSKNGLLSITRADLLDLRLTIDNINAASLDDRFNLEKTVPGYYKKFGNILDNANLLIKNTNKIAITTDNSEKEITSNVNTFLKTSSKTVDNVNPLISRADKNLSDLDVIENNTEIKKIPENLNDLITNTNEFTIQSTKIEYDLSHPKGVLPWIIKHIW
jgi:hypothetical protein